MAVRSDTDHLAVALPGIAPLEDLDRHPANPPLPHELFGGFVKVDGVATGKSKSVVIDLKDLPRGPDPEHGAAGPAGPIGGGAVDNALPERGAQGGSCSVAQMVALALGVGRGAHLLHGGAAHRRLILGERMKTPGHQDCRKPQQ